MILLVLAIIVFVANSIYAWVTPGAYMRALRRYGGASKDYPDYSAPRKWFDGRWASDRMGLAAARYFLPLWCLLMIILMFG